MTGGRVLALKQRLYADQVDGTSLFRQLLSEYVGHDARVLDLGCGRGKETTDIRGRAGFVVGCDVSDAVKQNRWVQAAVRGDAYALPFRGGVFHAVVMDFVMEHLADPASCARELMRVLRPGGHVIFRTPNRYHYVPAVAAMTPHWLHRALANRVRGLPPEADGDVFETHYKANTRPAVARVFGGAGFRVERIMMVEREPSYLMFAAAAFWLGYVYERCVNRFERLAWLRSNIFGVVSKAP